MSLNPTTKEALLRMLAPHGYTLSRLHGDVASGNHPAPNTEVTSTVVTTEPRVEPMDAALRDILNRKHVFKNVIDIGASDGRWTQLALQHFPNCSYLLIEAQPVHVQALKVFQAAHPNVNLVLAAAGEKPGTINFDASDPFGGVASEHPFPANNIVIPVTTLDHEVRTRKLEGPFLLKFDTHGFEVPILNGATEMLAQTEAIIIECYNFRIAPQCLLFHEIIALLEKKGFRCIDLIDPTRRPLDNCLWQVDLVFARNSRAEFSHPRYQ